MRSSAATPGTPATDSPEPRLGEDSYRTDPAVGLARFHKLDARGGDKVVWSQGGVIPDVIGKLTGVRSL